MAVKNIGLFKDAVKVVGEYNRKVSKNSLSGFSKFTVQGTTANFKDLLIIVPIPAHIVAQMSRLPSDYAYWGMVYSELEDEKADAQYVFDSWYADKYDEVTAYLSPKATETRKETEVIVKYGELYKEKKTIINKLSVAMRKVKILQKALEYKKDMLQSIGAMIRQEIDQAKMVDKAIMTSRETGKNINGGATRTKRRKRM